MQPPADEKDLVIRNSATLRNGPVANSFGLYTGAGNVEGDIVFDPQGNRYLSLTGTPAAKNTASLCSPLDWKLLTGQQIQATSGEALTSGDVVTLSPSGGLIVAEKPIFSGTMAGTSVTDLILTPDTNKIVYRVTSGDLFSINIDGTDNISLDTGVTSFPDPQVSSDNNWVVYAKSGDLYSVPILGGTPILLNTILPGGNVDRFFIVEVSMGNFRVVYVGDFETDGTREIFSAPISMAGMQIKLNDNIVAGGTLNFNTVKVSPDGSHVVYVGDLVTDSVREIFSAQVDMAGTQITLNDPPVAGGGISFLDDFKIAPDSSRVVYDGDLDTDGINELYSAQINMTGTQIKLNAPLVAGQNTFSSNAKISPDSSRVVYYGDLNTNGVNEVYSAQINMTGTQVRLNTPMVAGQFIVPDSITISPDSTRVVYVGNLNNNLINEIFSVPIAAAGMQVKLNGAVVAGGDVSSNLIRISPDSTRVVYYGELDTNGTNEIYSAPIATANMQVKLNGAVAGTGIPFGGDNLFQISPDSTRVTYVGSFDNTFNEIYSAPIATANMQITLNMPVVMGGDVLTTFGGLFTNDSSRVIFAGNILDASIVQIFNASATTANSAFLVSAVVKNTFQYQTLGIAQETVGNGELVCVLVEGNSVAPNGAMLTPGVTYGLLTDGTLVDLSMVGMNTVGTRLGVAVSDSVLLVQHPESLV